MVMLVWPAGQARLNQKRPQAHLGHAAPAPLDQVPGDTGVLEIGKAHLTHGIENLLGR